jgi:hypothetical protein
MLTPVLAQRIQLYASEHQPEYPNPAAYTAQIMARLWSGDQLLFALLIVDPEAGMPTGHLLADGRTPAGPQIVQLRADQNVGNAKSECVQAASEWAHQLGSPQVILNVHRDPKTWTGLGFQQVRHVLLLKFPQAQPLRLVEGQKGS